MSTNSSVPEPDLAMPASEQSGPNYPELVRFLVQPFLEVPEALKVDCEINPMRSRVWIRLAFEGSDKGRVFGRGGRTIQAIRTVIEAAARAVGHSVYLDVYGAREEPPKTNGARRNAPKRRTTSGID